MELTSSSSVIFHAFLNLRILGNKQAEKHKPVLAEVMMGGPEPAPPPGHMGTH